MKQQLMIFARDLDALCAKLNDGLAAVAVLLGVLVIGMMVVRAEQIMPDPSTPPAAFSQVALGR